MALTAALVLLLAVLAFAVVRPGGFAEVWAAGPAALLVVLTGLVGYRDTLGELRRLGPTVGFLAAVLLLAYLAGQHGVFTYMGARAIAVSRGRPRRLLAAVFVAASLTTAVLSLDATVVLLTPVMFAAATRLRVGSRPYTYACAHLANSASLLLPVSNLTNLLAFGASGRSFPGFAAVMALPWLAVIAVEYGAFRLYFRRDLTAPAGPPGDTAGPPGDTAGPPRNTAAPSDSRVPGSVDNSDTAPRYALITLALALIGFAVAQPLGVHPAWVAVAGAIILAVPLLRRRDVRPMSLITEANPGFCLFVFALGIVVLAVRQHGLDRAIDAIVPAHAGLLELLAVAGLAAVLANLLNNLPAVLVLVPAVSSSPGLLLAVLIGVNVGPNLTYVGSLATLLWRQILHRHDAAPSTGDFLKLGAMTVPASLLAGTVVLWLVL